MYSQKIRPGNYSTINKDTRLLDDFLTDQALRINGFDQSPGFGRVFATLVTGGVVIVPATTLPGDMVYFQPIGQHIMFTVLYEDETDDHSTASRKIWWKPYKYREQTGR
ncbi:hypothetical protein BKA65DRAFT_486137 [Rhexocercosporidium sp. MPI-PUGE-AT-0058]|nr:hypothetical protein BKA65DRAFT_486137 [Rhexocercosporidium sp. MPI-PUGE-AT-0058]